LQSHFNPDERYALFINAFDVRGAYAQEFAPEAPVDSLKRHLLERWILAEEHLLLTQRNSSMYFTTTGQDLWDKSTQMQQAIQTDIDAGKCVYVLMGWAYHAINITFFKDNQNNTLVIITNKGQGTIENQPVHCFYVAAAKQELIKDLIFAAACSDRFVFDLYLKDLIQSANVVSIRIPASKKLQDRGNCTLIAGKRIYFDGELLQVINDTQINLTQFLKPNTHTAIDLETELKAEAPRLAVAKQQAKARAYAQKWKLALQVSEGLFEVRQPQVVHGAMFQPVLPNQNEIDTFGVQLYQAFTNIFRGKPKFKSLVAAPADAKEEQKADAKADGELANKQQLEIKYIEAYFNECLQKKLYQSAFILLMNAAKAPIILSTHQQWFMGLVLKFLAEKITVVFSETMEQVLLKGLLILLETGDMQTADVQYELLNRCVKMAPAKKWPAEVCLILTDQQAPEVKLAQLISLEPDAIARKAGLTQALRCAAMLGNEKAVKFLLQQDINIDGTDSILKATALSHSATKGHLNIVKLLVQIGARLEAEADLPHPLEYAAAEGHLHVVRYFCEEQKQHMTEEMLGAALINASQANQLEVVKNFVEELGCNINFKNKAAETALFCADTLAMTQYLISKNADPNIRVSNGISALGSAAYRGKFDIVDYYLQNHPQLLNLIDLIACLQAALLNIIMTHCKQN